MLPLTATTVPLECNVPFTGFSPAIKGCVINTKAKVIQTVGAVMDCDECNKATAAARQGLSCAKADNGKYYAYTVNDKITWASESSATLDECIALLDKIAPKS